MIDKRCTVNKKYVVFVLCFVSLLIMACVGSTTWGGSNTYHDTSIRRAPMGAPVSTPSYIVTLESCKEGDDPRSEVCSFSIRCRGECETPSPDISFKAVYENMGEVSGAVDVALPVEQGKFEYGEVAFFGMLEGRGIESIKIESQGKTQRWRWKR
jgi:hypothetical protein